MIPGFSRSKTGCPWRDSIPRRSPRRRCAAPRDPRAAGPTPRAASRSSTRTGVPAILRTAGTPVPLEGLEPPTVSLGRNCSSIELQRRAANWASVGRGRKERAVEPEAEARLRELEESLWRPETRYDLAYMRRVLTPDFLEFGRSGRVYRLEDTLATTPAPFVTELP